MVLSQPLSPTFKTANTSDWHLVHPRTKTSHILANLRHYFLNVEFAKTLDVLFLAGDLWDREALLKQEEVAEVSVFIEDLLSMYGALGVPIRILLGTPRHDWRQSRLFVDINRAMGDVCDLKYFDDVTIEKNASLGLNILYIPDEYRETCAETQMVVEARLLEAGLTEVDIAVMHGCFEYQFPRNMPKFPDCHSIEYYCSIVKHYITIGHVHSFSRFKKAFANSSFDRLAHGEEEPKGFVVVECVRDNPKKNKVNFIENAGAQRYDTIDVTDLDINLANQKITDHVKALSWGSYVRIIAQKDSPLLANLSEYRKAYPHFHWSSEKHVEVTHVYDIKEYTKSDRSDRVSITKENISHLVEARLGDMPLDEKNDVLNLLEKLKHV